MIHLVFNGIQSVIIVADPYIRSLIQTPQPEATPGILQTLLSIPLMECEVIVVGAGIGGLTTAALLAARGVNVCVFERQSQVGGCAASFEHLGYSFEPTCGLYSGWEAGASGSESFQRPGISASRHEAVA